MTKPRRKGMLKSLLCAGLLGIMAWSPAMADQGKDSKACGGWCRPGMGGQWGGGKAGDRMEMMKKRLNLSDSQVFKLKDLFKKQMEETKPLRDQLKIDMDKLQQKIDTKAAASDLKDLLDQLQKDRQDLQASREKLTDQLRDILSPEQQAKFVLDMRNRGMRMMKKWGHRGGPMGKMEAHHHGKPKKDETPVAKD
jgi:Spy/CpxP family protein refolding chaperone